MRKSIIIMIALFFAVSVCWAFEDKEQKPEIAGELFGVPVSAGNYYFAMRVAAMYSTPWGGRANNLQKLEERTWDDLLLSYEAFQRGIEVSDEELEEEIGKTLKGHKVSFDWKKDKKVYQKWVEENLKAPVDMFENQLRHLIQIRKLHKQILDSIEPEVTEEEAVQEFLNEYNTLSVSLAQFDDLESAQSFYEKAKEDSSFWDKEVEKDKEKPKEENRFRNPGFVSLEFLMHMWKFPKDACYDMIEMEIGSIYPPKPIYKGYGVFKVLQIRKADKNEFQRLKESYYGQIRHQKQYKGFYEWFNNLKKEAKIKKYIKPPEGLFQQSSE